MESIVQAAARFQARKCMPGRLARHPVYGLCHVLSADGWQRALEYWGPASEQPDIVHADVRELTEPNPMRDLGLA